MERNAKPVSPARMLPGSGMGEIVPLTVRSSILTQLPLPHTVPPFTLS